MALHPSVRFGLICIFLDALGIGLIVPVLPTLIGDLAASREAQTLWYGAIMLSYGLVQFASAPFLGAISDRAGRRPVLLGGIFGLGCMFAVPAFTDSLWLILASRLVGGLLSANMTVAQAYIADITVGFERAGAFGKVGAVFGIGFVLGPALGGVLGEQSVRLPFLVAGAICIANFCYGLLVLPESLSPEQRVKRPLSFKDNNPLAAIGSLTSLTGMRPFVAVLILTSLANGVIQCTWALYTQFRYGFTPLLIGISVFALGAVLAFVQGWALPRMLGHLAARRTVTVSLLLAGISLCAIAVSPWGWLACVACCTYAIGACVGPTLTSIISANAPCESQGATMGAVSALNSLTGALAPAIGTPMLLASAKEGANVLAGAPYFLSAALLLISLLIAVLPSTRSSWSEGF